MVGFVLDDLHGPEKALLGLRLIKERIKNDDTNRSKKSTRLMGAVSELHIIWLKH